MAQTALAPKSEEVSASLPSILIVEQGSQYTLKIDQVYRNNGYRAAIVDHRKADKWIKKNKPRLVVYSGSKHSVYDDDAPSIPADILIDKPGTQQPFVVAICYGLQRIGYQLGGDVEAANGNGEYAEATITVCDDDHLLFRGLPKSQSVWMSHGDSLTRAPPGYSVLALTETGAVAAMASKRVMAVQYHLEVSQTTHGAEALVRAAEQAGCEPDWKQESVIAVMQSKARAYPMTTKFIMGMSGGVDSTTVGAVLSPVLGERLLAITIDGGHLRENEMDEIGRHSRDANLQWKVIDARAEFLDAMSSFVYASETAPWWKKLAFRIANRIAKGVFGYKGVTDAEVKRKRFKLVYADIFMREAARFGATVVVQGTLAPDRIESGATGGDTIKSHHNVGLWMGKLIQMHPIDHLFKHEVRVLAKDMGLPESVWSRQPFPGPGKFLRIVGTPITAELLDLVGWADARVTEVLKKHGVYGEISQLVVAYMGVNTVGVEGDARVYKGSIVVRAVQTIDFMTAEGVWFSKEVVHDIKKILRTHPGFVRVFFDVTDKPKGTTELE